MTRYTVRALSVLAVHPDGSTDDLNAKGNPCESAADLRAFIADLHAQGAYDADTMANLLAAVEAL